MKRTAPLCLALALSALPLVAEDAALDATSAGRATDQHGTSHTLDEFDQGLVVVDFAASWCEPCYEALPRLQVFARAHPAVRFVVVSVDTSTAGRDRLVRDLGLELPVLWDGDHRIVERFAPERFPATYLLRDGRIIHRTLGSGERGWNELVAEVERLDGRDGE